MQFQWQRKLNFETVTPRLRNAIFKEKQLHSYNQLSAVHISVVILLFHGTWLYLIHLRRYLLQPCGKHFHKT